MPSRNLPLAALITSAALVLACGSSEEEAASAARAEEWAALQTERATLDDLRTQLEAARAQSPPATEPTLQTRVDEETARFLERLVAFINDNVGLDGDSPPQEVAAAIRTKSSEDLLLAGEHIERGGDYAKAIDILQSARGVDPANQELETALAEAERLRYMDEQRFSEVGNGMTEDEVRHELGQVQHQNVRRYEDGKVMWLYPKGGGAAAGVLFRAEDGQLRVYDTNFDAVESAAERAADGESVEDPAGD